MEDRLYFQGRNDNAIGKLNEMKAKESYKFNPIYPQNSNFHSYTFLQLKKVLGDKTYS